MSISKKTGLYLTGTTAEIVERVMQEQGFTKISNVVNYIINEYNKLLQQPKKEVEVKPVEEKKVFDSWFVVEEK